MPGRARESAPRRRMGKERHPAAQLRYLFRKLQHHLWLVVELQKSSPPLRKYPAPSACQASHWHPHRGGISGSLPCTAPQGGQRQAILRDGKSRCRVALRACHQRWPSSTHRSAPDVSSRPPPTNSAGASFPIFAQSTSSLDKIIGLIRQIRDRRAKHGSCGGGCGSFPFVVVAEYPPANCTGEGFTKLCEASPKKGSENVSPLLPLLPFQHFSFTRNSSPDHWSLARRSRPRCPRPSPTNPGRRSS